MFERPRFNKTTTTRGRKKKLQVEPGKSISQADLQPYPTPPKTIEKKNKKKRILSELSSSEGTPDETMVLDDSDDDPKTFSDLQDEISRQTDQNISVDAKDSTDNLTIGNYILTNMNTDTGDEKRFVAKTISTYEDDTHMYMFLRPSAKIQQAFVYSEVEDTGIVHREEINKKLLNFGVLRRGQIQFKRCGIIL